MINKTDGINMIVKIFIEKILFELRGSVSNYPPRLELPRLTVGIERTYRHLKILYHFIVSAVEKLRLSSWVDHLGSES